MSLTPEQHRERHKLLHRMLDELWGDYIMHHRSQHGFWSMPLSALLEWSHSQTLRPCEYPESDKCQCETVILLGDIDPHHSN